MREDERVPSLHEPSREEVLEFCARAPVERVFLEEMALRAIGRFVALRDDDGELRALCHAGANLVPSGAGCGAFVDVAVRVIRPRPPATVSTPGVAASAPESPGLMDA